MSYPCSKCGNDLPWYTWDCPICDMKNKLGITQKSEDGNIEGNIVGMNLLEGTITLQMLPKDISKLKAGHCNVSQ